MVSAMADDFSRRAFLGTAALNALPAVAQESKRPNFLFTIRDDWRFGHSGAYGCNTGCSPPYPGPRAGDYVQR